MFKTRPECVAKALPLEKKLSLFDMQEQLNL